MNRLAIVLLLLAACGDNDPDNDPAPDAPAADAPPQRTRAIVVAGNFMPGQAGVMSVLDIDGLTVEQRVAPDGSVGSDPVIRKVGDELFVVNRIGENNVSIFDAATLMFKQQIGTGVGTNPQDVAVVGDKLFLPAFDTAGVVVVGRDGRAPVTIDLSALDPDGQPNCNSAIAVAGTVYVTCGLLDQNFAPRGPGKLAVIDGATSAVTTIVTLMNGNPFGAIEHHEGRGLVVPTVPDIIGNPLLGCVERVEITGAPQAAGCFVTNAELGGFATRTDSQSGFASALWLVVSTSFTTAQVRRFDSGGLAAPFTPASQLPNDVARCPNGDLVVSDRTMAANGLRVFRNEIERTTAPLPIGLSPASAHGLVCY